MRKLLIHYTFKFGIRAYGWLKVTSPIFFFFFFDFPEHIKIHANPMREIHINPFFPNAPSFYPLKISDDRKVSVFRERKGTLRTNGSVKTLLAFYSMSVYSKDINSDDKFPNHCVKSFRVRSFSGLCSVWMRENTDQKNSEYGQLLRNEQ